MLIFHSVCSHPTIGVSSKYLSKLLLLGRFISSNLSVSVSAKVMRQTLIVSDSTAYGHWLDNVEKR